MIEAVRFPYMDADSSHPGTSAMPILPIKLARGNQEVAGLGLLDTGAAANVLPYSIGLRLGFSWEQQNVSVVLTGNLAQVAARGVIVSGVIEHFTPVRLAFAWAQTDDIRLLLGQANFFHEFDTCFFRSRSEFEIRPKR